MISETSLVFIGAGERLLCYDINRKIRLWEDVTDLGFWGWRQSGPFILMSAETEFGVWNQSGERLWSTFVEPPWNYVIKGEVVKLDVMGDVRTHRLSDGTQLK